MEQAGTKFFIATSDRTGARILALSFAVRGIHFYGNVCAVYAPLLQGTVVGPPGNEDASTDSGHERERFLLMELSRSAPTRFSDQAQAIHYFSGRISKAKRMGRLLGSAQAETTSV